MTPPCSKEREGVYIRVEEERRAAGWFFRPWDDWIGGS